MSCQCIESVSMNPSSQEHCKCNKYLGFVMLNVSEGFGNDGEYLEKIKEKMLRKRKEPIASLALVSQKAS